MTEQKKSSFLQRLGRGLGLGGPKASARHGGAEDASSYGGSAIRNWSLVGESEDGHPVEVQLSEAQLARHKYGLAIGRHDQLCEIALDHGNLSRRHARFRLLDGRLAMEDLNSANGSMVDGKVLKPFQPEPLNDGSAIVLADIRLNVSASGH
jgi:hypothetical protein